MFKEIKKAIRLYKNIKKLTIEGKDKKPRNQPEIIEIEPEKSENFCTCGKEKGPFEQCYDCHQKIKEEERIKLMTRVFWKKVESIGEKEKCPYCRKKLSKFPGRKKKCEFCKEYIFPKTRPDRIRVIVKDNERKKIDELYGQYMDAKNLNDYGFVSKSEDDSLAISTMSSSGFNAKDYKLMEKQLLKSFGHRPNSKDVVWGIFNKKIIESKSHQDRAHIYWNMARFKYEEDKDPYPIMKNANKSHLLHFRDSRLNMKVSINAYTGGCCKECLKQNNKIYTIEKAMDEMPLPCKKCSHNKNAKGFGWCRCMWQAKLD